MMRIAIDGRMYQESGIGRYLRNLLENLKVIDRDNEYYILHRQPEYDTLVYHTNFQKVLVNLKWYGFKEQIELPRILNKLKPDLVHFPHFNVPIFYKGKFVVTIHDLIHQHFQMNHATTLDPITYKIKKLGYGKVFKNAVTKSLKILVPSKYVKQLLNEEWGMPDEKIEVTPEAADDKLFTIVNNLSTNKISGVMKKFNIRKPYLFYIGNAHPHKNIEGLIKVFLELRKNYKDLTLVLSGNDNYFWQRIKMHSRFRSLREASGNGIVYAGSVDDEQLVALYKNASCFVIPSFEEGFGLPLLEAMTCSCPVVSSNGGSLPEVGGDAAVYFNPHDYADMEDKINMVLKSDKLRKEMIEKGKKRVKFFSWEKLAKQTLEVYNQCVLQ